MYLPADPVRPPARPPPRLGLAAANPLLSDTLEVRGGGRLQAAMWPHGGRLPYTAASIEV
jgi:hypothetical protein